MPESPIKRFFSSRLFLIVAFVVAVTFAVGYARAYYQDYKIKQEIKALKEEVSSLEKKKLESLELLEYVMSDAFVEEKARTELNLKRPGEEVLLVRSADENNDGPEDSDTAGSSLQPLSNAIKWWYYFTHKEP